MRFEPANDPRPAPSPPPPAAQGSLSWMVELVVLFGLILGLDLLFGPGTALLDSRPHPFWIPVLVMAACHGLVPGLLAALAGTALSWWTAPRLSPALADHFSQWAQLWHEPVLWFCAALLLGAYRDAQRQRREDAERRWRRAEHRSETIALYAEELRAHVAQLEREIALAPRTGDAPADARVVPFGRLDAAARRGGERKP